MGNTPNKPPINIEKQQAAPTSKPMTYCQPKCALDQLLLACIRRSPQNITDQKTNTLAADIPLQEILPKYLSVNEILQHWTWYEAETEQTTIQALLDEKFEQAKQSGLWAQLKEQPIIDQGALILTLPSDTTDTLYVQDGWHRLAIAQRLQNIHQHPQYLRVIFTFDRKLHYVPPNRSPEHRRADHYTDAVEMLGF